MFAAKIDVIDVAGPMNDARAQPLGRKQRGGFFDSARKVQNCGLKIWVTPANRSSEVTMRSAKVEHLPCMPWNWGAPRDLACRNPRDRAHTAMIQIALRVGHRGMEVERSAGSHKLLEMSDPTPFDCLKQDLVPHGISAAPQKPFTAFWSKRILTIQQVEIAARRESIQQQDGRLPVCSTMIRYVRRR